MIIDYYDILHNLLDKLTNKKSKRMDKLYEWFENDENMKK